MTILAQAQGATVATGPQVSAATVFEAAAGDRVAFARIVEAYHRDMIRAAYVVSGDPQLAQDATQGAWAIAWRKLGSVRDPNRVRAWLVAVAVNEARQAIRREHRHAVAELNLEGRADVADPPDSIDHLALVNLLARLSTRDRTLLALRYVARLESPEIAQIVRMSPSGVRGHLSRLLERLRKELGDD